MVQYSEAIYNIIRKKIKDIEDVNNYKAISETLLSTNTKFDDKVNQLYTYLKNEGTNISKIKTLIPNQKLLSVLNNCYENIDNIDINNINQQIIKYVIKYYRENTDINNDNIDINRQSYDDSKDISDDEYNNIINSLNILKKQKTIYNILNFIFTCGFNDLYKSQLNDDYSEFNIIDRWYNALKSPQNIANINKDDIINIYKVLSEQSTLKELYDQLVKLKNYTNTNIELNYNKNVENEKTTAFINSRWTVNKNDNILNSSITSVNNFLTFFNNDDNVNKITSNDIFNSWNIQLMNIYNNIINMQNYLQFFKRLKDLKDDKELQEFCIDQNGFNDNQIKIKNNNILHKFQHQKVKDDDKKTVEEFINEIIDNYNNKGVVITEQVFKDDVQLLKKILISSNKESEDPNQIIQCVKESLNKNEVDIINNYKKPDRTTYGKVYSLLSTEQVALSAHDKNKSEKYIDKETIGEHIITELQTVLTEKFNKDIKIKNENNSFFKSFDNLISNNDNKIISFFNQFEDIEDIEKVNLYQEGILEYFSNRNIYKYLSTFYSLMRIINKFN